MLHVMLRHFRSSAPPGRGPGVCGKVGRQLFKPLKRLTPPSFHGTKFFHTMTGIVTNIIQNSLSGFVTGAVTTVGGYAGAAVNGVGNLIESSGQAVGNGGFSYYLIKETLDLLTRFHRYSEKLRRSGQ